MVTLHKSERQKSERKIAKGKTATRNEGEDEGVSRLLTFAVLVFAVTHLRYFYFAVFPVAVLFFALWTRNQKK